MRTHYTIALSMFAGAALGAAAVQGLHAQATPPVYQVTEIEVLNAEGYLKDFAPRAQAGIKAAGGRFLAVGGKVSSIEGEPAKGRVAIIAWESAEKAQAWRSSAAFKELESIRQKLAKFRIFTVEGMAQ